MQKRASRLFVFHFSRVLCDMDPVHYCHYEVEVKDCFVLTLAAPFGPTVIHLCYVSSPCKNSIASKSFHLVE